MDVNFPPKTAKEAEHYINLALGFALLSVIINVGFSLGIIFLGTQGAAKPEQYLFLIDTVIVSILAYGLYKRNLIAAILLALFMILSGFTMGFSGLRSLYIFFMIMGVLGVYYYKKNLKATPKNNTANDLQHGL